MISKSKIKYIHSLELKKNRDAEGLFIAEGPKVVGDIAACHPDKLRMLVASEKWIESQKNRIETSHCELITVNDDELSKASFLCHPQQVLAIFEKFSNILHTCNTDDALTLVLDGIQDPGNMGTIVRIADWFGIENIVCSHDTVDVYNPKVVQATMGSIARVSVTYTDLNVFLDNLPSNTPIYGTLLDGKNMYKTRLTRGGVIIMGNEGKGISTVIRKRITHSLRIPNYPESRNTAESLNVAIATAVICAEFRRMK